MILMKSFVCFFCLGRSNFYGIERLDLGQVKLVMSYRMARNKGKIFHTAG
jgi:hypothetical protein